MTEDLKTLLTVIRHREIVGDYLASIAGYLRWRAREHDRSKLQFDEFEGFTRINKTARNHAYGSKEYDESLASAKQEGGCCSLHFSRNRHHPEFFENPKDMGLFDLIELVCDWKAATETYGNNTLAESLEVQRKRFDFDDWQWKVIDDVVRFVDGGMQSALVQRDAAVKIDKILDNPKGLSDMEIVASLVAFGITFTQARAMIDKRTEAS